MKKVPSTWSLIAVNVRENPFAANNVALVLKVLLPVPPWGICNHIKEEAREKQHQ